MKRHQTRISVVFLAVGLVCAMPGPAAAGTQDGAVVALHVGPHSKTGDTPCGYADGEALFPCRDFQTAWPLNTPANVYLIVARGAPDPGVAGASCGILYNHGETGQATKSDGVGVDVFAWTLCSWAPWVPGLPPEDLFPASGGGIRLVWSPQTDCQTGVVEDEGVHALAGSFYVLAYSDDMFEITPNRTANPGVDEFQVLDCDNQTTVLPYPEAAGVVAFGSGTGYTPCQAVPVIPTTWSRLKIRYGAAGGGAP